MSDQISRPCTAFEGARQLISGPLVEVALAVKAATKRAAGDPVFVFDDATGKAIDLDLRGSKADIIKRLSQPPKVYAGRYAPRPASVPEASSDVSAESSGRGRPKLGVVAREVTLLPRHWEWLGAQAGGASAVLRKLVDEARKNGGEAQKRKAAREAAYHVMTSLAGNLPHYEEATRALFADDRAAFEKHISNWPKDISAYALRLAFER